MRRYSAFWLSLAAVALFLSKAHAQTPGSQYQSYSYQYYTGTVANNAAGTTIKAWNSEGLPKWFTLQATGADTPFQLQLQGSLDGANWQTIAITTSYTGTISNQVPLPFLYLRAFGSSVPANKVVTATFVGSW